MQERTPPRRGPWGAAGLPALPLGFRGREGKGGSGERGPGTWELREGGISAAGGCRAGGEPEGGVLAVSRRRGGQAATVGRLWSRRTAGREGDSGVVVARVVHPPSFFFF